MSKLTVNGLELLNYNEGKDLIRYKIAGLIIFDCLLDVNDEYMPERRIEIANHICKVLENDKLPLVVNELVLRTASAAIGHFARVATTVEAEFLQNSYFSLSMKLIGNNKSDSHRFSGALILTHLAINAPALIFSKRKMLFTVIWDVVSDKSSMVRSAATGALEASLQVISQRESMTDYISSAIKQLDVGFSSNMAEKIIGSLTILDTIIGGVIVNVSDLYNTIRLSGTQIQEIIWKVLQRKDWRDPDVRLKIMEIVPNLATAFSSTFLQPNSYTGSHNFLSYSVKHLTDIINGKKERLAAFQSLGRLLPAMSNHFKTSSNVSDVFEVICSGFTNPFCVQALTCLATLLNIAPAARKILDNAKVENMFRGGLSMELVDALKVVVKFVPHLRTYVQLLLRNQITSTLSVQPLFIDEIRNRPASSRVQTVPKESKSYIWNTGASSIFGSSKPVESIGQETSQTIRQDQSVIFALRVLTTTEFFPKQFRERGDRSDDDQSNALLLIIRDYVVTYIDDHNTDIRRAAAEACVAVIDAIVLSIDPESVEFSMILQILNRLLVMGVGDDNQNTRIFVFQGITPSMDYAVSLTDSVHCLLEALNDEHLEVRASAMTVLARVAHHDTLRIMPIVRLTLKRLIFTLNNNDDHLIKQESVRILQSLVRGSDILIVPYVKQIISPLMTLLGDQSAEVVVAALSTVGELASASPASVRDHLDDLVPRIIDALHDRSSIAKQETAVVAMGKLVSTLTMVTEEPYKKYSGLFEGLVKAVQIVDESSSELRLQAIKTLGLLGAVDGGVYQKHLASSNPVLGVFAVPSDLLTDELDDDLSINKSSHEEKKLSKIERHYFSVVIRELMNVLRDSTLSQHHQAAAGIAIKTVRTLGLQSCPQLDEIICGFLFRLYQVDSGNNIKDALLDHLITLIQLMGKNIKKMVPEIVKLIRDFFDSHLQLCLDIFEALGMVLSPADFSVIAQGILPLLYKAINDENLASNELLVDDDNTSDHAQLTNKVLNPILIKATVSNSTTNKSIKILQKLAVMNEWIGEYRRDIIPFILKILDNTGPSSDVKREAISTVLFLANEPYLHEFVSRMVQSLLRALTTTDMNLNSHIITALSALLCKLGTGFLPFIVPIRRRLKALFPPESQFKGRIDDYESLVNRLLKQKPLPTEPLDALDISIKFDDRIRNRGLNAKTQNEMNFQVNTQSLESAWALADKRNATNLIEWMRRLMIELIRQSPSFILRSCSTLAKVHRPLAEELFNNSFHCIWEELFSFHSNEVVVDNPLIAGIEMVLSSTEVPKNILVSLLNLAEYMDIQDRPLPIDVTLLAQQTQIANMFAKCLRYREIEFSSKNVPPSFECIDALISVNNQLGLSDRAVGVLRYLRFAYPHIDIQPQWLEKLCRWEDAYNAYEVDIKVCQDMFKDGSPWKHDRWMQNELGRLRCLKALGEYEELESKARSLKDMMKVADEIADYQSRSCFAEIQRLGANAAWMLGKWNAMEDFLEGDVKGCDIKDVALDHNLSFYNAILAIHNHDYARATSLITETRNAISSSISSLLSESYSRANRAMVTMQILAEMEEVVEYRQYAEKLNLDVEALKTTVTDVQPLINPILDSKSTDKGNVISGELAVKKVDLIRKWKARLKWAPKDVDVYRQILVSCVCVCILLLPACPLN
jgi:FKBP12-rapamycin complex-associated protein